MPTTALDTLIRTGLSLPAVDYFKLDESSGTTAANQVSGRNNGSYVGSPTLAAAGDIFPESNGGNAVSTNGSSQHVDLGTSSREWADAIDNTGLTILINLKQLTTPGSPNSTLLGMAGNSTFAVQTFDAFQPKRFRLQFTDSTGAVTFNTLSFETGAGNVVQPWMLSNVWLCVYFNKTGNVCRAWVDGQELTTSAASGTLATGTIAASGVNCFVGAQNTAGTAGSYASIKVQRVAAFYGLLTDADRIAIMRAATVTDVTGKLYGLINDWDATDPVKFRDGSDVQVANGAGVYAWDAYRTGMVQAVQATGANQPTRQDSANGTELDLDNEYQNAGTPRRQSFAATLTQTVHSQWCTLAAVCRPAANSILGVSAQTLIGFRYAAATWIGLAIEGTTGKVGVLRNGSVIMPVDPFPRARTTPGISCIAITPGSDQTAFKAHVFSDGTSALTATSIATGAYYDQNGSDFYLGGDSSTYGDLFAGRINRLHIARCPIQASALADWESATRARLGYPAAPRTHVHIAHDSIGSMVAADANKGYQSSLPPRYSYTNSSRAGDKQAEQITTLTAWGSNIFPASATMKIGLIAVGRNDVQTGTPSLATMQTQYASIRSLLITAGANRIIAVKVNPSDLGVVGASWNAYLDTVVGLGLADRVITLPSMTFGNGLTVSDGIHPTNEGHQAIYKALWLQGAPWPDQGSPSRWDEGRSRRPNRRRS